MSGLKELDRRYERLLSSVASKLKPHSVNILYLSFAFVFIYFGIQKPLPIYSPVANQLYYIAGFLSVSPSLLVDFVGFYEIIMGILFLFRAFKPAALMFVPHQIITFLSLTLMPYSVFQPPWINVAYISLPVLLGRFSAFVFKNVVFVAAFLLLLVMEYAEFTEN